MYAKVYKQIFDSSVAEHSQSPELAQYASLPIVRWVFEDLLKLAENDGVVDMTYEAIARRTNVPVEIVRHAVSELLKPDPKSRTTDEEGRRLLQLDPQREWGWLIVNYSHYRNMRDKTDLSAYKRNYNRIWMRDHRAKTKAAGAKPAENAVLDKLDNVRHCLPHKDKEQHEELEPILGLGNINGVADCNQQSVDALVIELIKTLMGGIDANGRSAGTLRKLLSSYTRDDFRALVGDCITKSREIKHEVLQRQRERATKQIRNPMGVFVNWLKRRVQ